MSATLSDTSIAGNMEEIECDKLEHVGRLTIPGPEWARRD
jgi:hypothetical protein